MLFRSLPPRDVAVAYSEPGTPAGDNGLERGDRILSIDGYDVVNDVTEAGVDYINAALYPSSSGVTHTFEVLDLVTQTVELVVLTAGEVTSTPVQFTQTLTSEAGATVGYMLFNDHLASAERALIDAVGRQPGCFQPVFEG